MVTTYFEKHRPIGYGIATSGIGIGTFVYPPLIRQLVFMFGWRGAVLLLGAVTLNICVFGSLMRQPMPAYRHAAIGYDDEGTRGTIDVHSSMTEHNPDDPGSVHLYSDTRQPSRQSIKARLKSFASTLKLHVFKSWNYQVLCVNTLLFVYSISIIYVYLPAYGESLGLSKSHSSILISALGIFNLIGRLVFGLLTKIAVCTPQRLYIAASVATGVNIILVPHARTFPSLLVASIGFGFLCANPGPLLLPVISEILSVPLSASGFSYSLLYQTVGTFLGPVTAGECNKHSRRHYSNWSLLCTEF